MKEVLRLEIALLLSKDAIRKVEPLDRLRGFYSTYFIVSKKDGAQVQDALALGGVSGSLE